MFCNPTLALNGSANRFWMSTNLAIIVVVVILHITVWVILKRKAVDYPGACSNRTSEATRVKIDSIIILVVHEWFVQISSLESGALPNEKGTNFVHSAFLLLPLSTHS
ncbi:unnamed protein product [Haemonchus placei]|uniref:G_PROTEIN_RECEP_F1_2 domain-containing protein n=1 Tax=Haemonchus placei TaxID=6290 RepID=A0A0N4WLK4_HAEPC|nr:unnamed protein product [Haemonchus placei]